MKKNWAEPTELTKQSWASRVEPAEASQQSRARRVEPADSVKLASQLKVGHNECVCMINWKAVCVCLLPQNAKTTKVLGLNFLYKYFSTQNIHLQICFQFQFIFALIFFQPNSFFQSNSNNTFFFDSMFFYPNFFYAQTFLVTQILNTLVLCVFNK